MRPDLAAGRHIQSIGLGVAADETAAQIGQDDIMSTGLPQAVEYLTLDLYLTVLWAADAAYEKFVVLELGGMAVIGDDAGDFFPGDTEPLVEIAPAM